jgi:hypothetical protein
MMLSQRGWSVCMYIHTYFTSYSRSANVDDTIREHVIHRTIDQLEKLDF